MNAVTKFHQTDEALYEMTKKALGLSSIEHFSAKPLSGGFCNAVYLIEANHQKMVLKIAPDPSVVLMRHERDILYTEAAVMKLFQDRLDIPMPKMIYFDSSCTLCPTPYFFMSFMEGEPLLQIEPKPSVSEIMKIKREIGVISRKISSLKTEYFGIPAMPETFTKNNCDFVLTLFSLLLEDAEDKEITVPKITKKELLELIESQRSILEEVKDPCYVHTDTWDGNIMVKNGSFIGLVDYAAVLYGDPLLHHDFHDFSPQPRIEFLEGFGKESITEHEQIRILIYKIWQRLGMIVERGYREYEDKNLYFWVLDEFAKEVENLKQAMERIHTMRREHHE